MPTASEPKTAGEPANGGRVDIPDPRVIEYKKIGLGTAGALLVAYFAYRLARRKDDRSAFMSAADEFRRVFAPDIAAVENDRLGHLDLAGFLRVAYDERHAAAVVAFEPFVAIEKRGGFRDAWNRYRYGENDDRTPATVSVEGLDHEEFYFLCYAPQGRSWETHIHEPAKQKALKRMRHLLSYAKET